MSKISQSVSGYYPYSSSFGRPVGAISTHHLVAISAEKIILILDTFSYQILYELLDHDQRITALAWNPNEPVLASGDEAGEIRI